MFSFSWPTRLPVAQESIAKLPNKELANRAKCFSFLLPFFFRWASSILCEPLMVVYAQNIILYGAVHNPIALLITLKFCHAFATKTVASTLGSHFLHLYARMQPLPTQWLHMMWDFHLHFATFSNVLWDLGSVWAERAGQGEVGGCTRRLQTAWPCLGSLVERPWLALEWQFLSFLA